jgi:hypothetical protein
MTAQQQPAIQPASVSAPDMQAEESQEKPETLVLSKTQAKKRARKEAKKARCKSSTLGSARVHRPEIVACVNSLYPFEGVGTCCGMNGVTGRRET